MITKIRTITTETFACDGCGAIAQLEYDENDEKGRKRRYPEGWLGVYDPFISPFGRKTFDTAKCAIDWFIAGVHEAFDA